MSFFRFSASVIVVFVAFSLVPHVSAGPVLVDGDGNVLGFYIQHESSGVGESHQAITDKSYHFELSILVYYQPTIPRLSQGRGHALFFESADCTGQPYTRTSTSGFVTAPIWVGEDLDAIEVFYVPHGEAIVTKEFQSSRSSLDVECDENPYGDSMQAARVFPNDPDVTGFFNPTPPAPMVLRSSNDPAVTGCLFRDRFQCAN